MIPRKKREIYDPIQNELESIKKLLILILLKSGATQDEVALSLGINQSGISRMFPASKLKKFEIFKTN